MTVSQPVLSEDKALLVETGFKQGCKLELNLGCFDVPKMDVMSKSDPFCVFYTRAGEDCWDRVGLTETIVDTHSCKWAKKFFLSKEETTSELRFEVFDRDSEKEALKAHDFIGYAEGRLVMSMLENGQTFQKFPLAKEGSSFKKDRGFLTLTLDWIEKPLINSSITLEVIVNYSVRASMFYTIMKKVHADNRYVIVYRSQLLDKHTAQFEPCTLKLTQLCGGSPLRLFRIELFHFYPNGRSKALGFVRTSVDELSNATSNCKLPWNSCNNGLDDARVFISTKGEEERFKNTFQVSILE